MGEGRRGGEGVLVLETGYLHRGMTTVVSRCASFTKGLVVDGQIIFKGIIKWHF